MPINLVERLASPGVLLRSWPHVAARRSMAGSDGVTIAQLADDLEASVRRLCEAIREGSYQPLPVLRSRPPFLDPHDRDLLLLAIQDQLVHRAVADLLAPQIDATLSASCRAFRRDSSASATAGDVDRWIEQGDVWVLRANIAGLAASIEIDRLLAKLSPFVDAQGLELLARVAPAEMLDQLQLCEAVTGLPQGSPLLPFLLNLYLAELDHLMARHHRRYLRYCDETIVLADSETAIRAAHDELQEQLAALSLHLTAQTTFIGRVNQGFVFLGFQFGTTSRSPSAKALSALNVRLNQLAASDDFNIVELAAVYRAWSSYFGDSSEHWTSHPAGLLCLLRRASASQEAEIPPQLAEQRWQLPQVVAPPLALALARAWARAGLAEQAWFELISLVQETAAEPPELAAWAKLLEVKRKGLDRVVGTVLEGQQKPSSLLSCLAEAVAGLGQAAVAERLQHFGIGPLAAAGEVTETGINLELLSDEELGTLVEWFQGQEGVHAVGPGLTPVPTPLTRESWRAHLLGQQTAALPLVRVDGTVLLGVIAVSLGGAEPATRQEQLIETCRRLLDELGSRGGAAVLELARDDTYRLWVRVEQPVLAQDLHAWLLDLIEAAGPLAPGIGLQVLPGQRRVRRGRLGPVVRLPLALDPDSGRRAELAADSGRPKGNPLRTLSTTRRLPAAVVREWAEEQRARRVAGISADEIRGRVAPLLEHCHVLRALQQQAAETTHLSRRELQVLLSTLGHLGEDGSRALHAIVAHCHDYRAAVLDRRIGRLPPHPVSCPRIRQWLPRISAEVGCGCFFDLDRQDLGAGAYPTPLLHVLEGAEVFPPATTADPGEADRVVTSGPPAAAAPSA